jgi:hypothetical protein
MGAREEEKKRRERRRGRQSVEPTRDQNAAEGDGGDGDDGTLHHYECSRKK